MLQRHAQAAKVVTTYDRSVWEDFGANGLSEGEHLLTSTWPQRTGVLSGLVAPERLAWLVATVFAVLALLHVRWAAGGRVSSSAVIPEVGGRPAFRPGTSCSRSSPVMVKTRRRSALA